MGAVVASRTRHPIGWLLIAFAIGWTLPLLNEQYSLHALVVAPGSLPGGRWAMWSEIWTFILFIPAILLVLLLFPTGTVRSARWRPLAIAAPLAGMVLAISTALTPGPMVGNLPAETIVTNPLGLPGAASLLKATTTLGGVLSLGLGLAGVLCLALRFRTSHGIERQQIKWLVFVALAAVLIVLIDIAAGRIAAGSDVHDAVDSIFWGLLVTTVLLGMPLAIGAAILRYRLFDIDRIISRTLSYALITGVYVGLVVLFQRATRSFTEGSDLAVAASTLLVAAAFVPVRRRVQNVVDRRFNRARYDAARTIETFSARLREEIDLEALGSELRDVVTRTMQPSRVQLWLRS